MRGLRLFVVMSMIGFAACQKAQKEQPRPEALDSVMLHHLVDLDQALDRALKEADDASSANDDARAAQLLDTKATPAADAALAYARATPAASPWGQARREELLGVMEARRAEIPKYAAALRGDDLDAKLSAVEAQLALQKRAMTAASAATMPPPPSP